MQAVLRNSILLNDESTSHLERRISYGTLLVNMILVSGVFNHMDDISQSFMKLSSPHKTIHFRNGYFPPSICVEQGVLMACRQVFRRTTEADAHIYINSEFKVRSWTTQAFDSKRRPFSLSSWVHGFLSPCLPCSNRPI